MKQRIFFIGSSLVVSAIFLWVAYGFYKAYQPKPLVLQGEIVAQSYNVAAKIPGRIGKIYVRKSQMVHKGDLLYTIYSPELEAKLKQAEAAKDAASYQKEQANNGTRKERINALKAQYEKALAAEKFLQKSFERIENLYKAGVVSEQKRDEVRTKYIAAKQNTRAAKELYEMAKKGARKELKLQVDAKERVFKAKVEEVNAFKQETKQYAFCNGEVAQILFHDGEIVPQGFPVITLYDMNDTWARLAVREDYLKYFKMGSTIDVQIPALSQKSFKMRVAHIAVMGSYATWKASESGQGFDLKSFEVELRPLHPIKGVRVGMSLLVTPKE